MSKDFGGKLDFSEDEMFARSEDCMEDYRYARSCSVAGCSDSARSPIPRKDLKHRASRDAFSDIFLPPYQVFARARESKAFCPTFANPFSDLESMPF